MQFRVTTVNSPLLIRNNPWSNAGVVGSLARGSVVDVPADSQVRNGFRLIRHMGNWSHWAADRYLTPVGPSPVQFRPPTDTPAEASYGISLGQELHVAENALRSHIRWHNPPAGEPGMGGIIPGFDNGLGRVQYPYLNWINGYRDASMALTRGVTPADIRAWAQRAEFTRPGTKGGMDKALQVWSQQASEDVQRLVGDNLRRGSDQYNLRLKLQVEIELALNRYLEAEVRRLGRSALGETVRWSAPPGYINPR